MIAFRCCSTKFFHVSRNLWTTFPYSTTLINIQNVLIAFSLQLNPVDTVTNGSKKLAVLTGDHIKEVFLTKKICMTVLPGGRKKLAVITRWTNYRGGRKAGFHCTQNSSTLSKIERKTSNCVKGNAIITLLHELLSRIRFLQQESSPRPSRYW